MTSVTIPATVTRIGDSAFEGCEKMVLTVPETVTDIGDMAFLECDGMADANGFVIVRGVLHHYAGSAKEVAIPEGVTRIGPEVFNNNNNLTAVTFPASLTSIGVKAFYGCMNLKDVAIPESVPDTGIGEMAFYGCMGLADADGFVVVRNYVHYYGGDKGDVTVPEGVAVVGRMAFSYEVIDNTDLKSVRLPVSVTSISVGAFLRCTALTEMYIPKSVSVIMVNAFRNTALDTVHVEPGYTHPVQSLIYKSRYADHASVNYIEDLPPTHEVVFNANGGSVSPASKFVSDGKAVGALPTPTRDGWTFDGWFTMHVNGDLITAETIVTADVIYYACWTKVPDPVTPDPGSGGGSVTPDPASVDPESLDPFNPGILPCYDVLNPADIWDPIQAPKAVTLRGAVYYGCDAVGIVELKVGKLKNRQAKVSGSVTLLDGKKYTIKSQKCYFDDKLAATLNLEVKTLGSMRIAIGSMGGVNVFSGELGKWHVQSAGVGDGWTASTATASVEIGDLSMFAGKVVSELLPSNEVATASGGKWTFKKAASVKWAKVKDGVVPLVQDATSGKGLIVDTSKGKTNLSGLKLTYTAKKGTFKGSFKVYALEGTKFKKYTVNVNGIVVDGVGYGAATCKKPVVSWPVMVK